MTFYHKVKDIKHTNQNFASLFNLNTSVMRLLLTFVCFLLFNALYGQTGNEKTTFQRNGFVFGLGLGAGNLTLNTNDTQSNAFSTTLPNIKVGFMFGNKIAILALLPGANYKYKEKDRGFEGITLIAQYWVKERWWVMGGTGLTLDAPAFYTVKDPKTAEFNTGFPALTAGTGHEIYRKGKFDIDLQYRFFYGQSNLDNSDFRKGFSNMFIVGFNLYSL